jgi:hypothetical protein
MESTWLSNCTDEKENECPVLVAAGIMSKIVGSTESAPQNYFSAVLLTPPNRN